MEYTSFTQISLLLVIGGLLFIFFSFFNLKGSASNKWFDVNRKGKVDVPIVILGGFLLVGGIALTIWEWNNTKTNAITTPTLTDDVLLVNTLMPEATVTEELATKVLPIESIPSYFFAYGGVEEQGFEGTADLLMHSIDVGQTYTLEYSLPENDSPSYVGLAFSFEKDQNLLEFSHIQITIDFGWPDTSCSFYIKDIADTPQTTQQVSLGHLLSGEGISVTNLGDYKYTFTIPLDVNFPDTNFSALSEIGFSLGTPSAHGDKEITFSDIKFLSP